MTEYDAIIIGAGQAGPSLAFRLAAEGNQVAIIERHLFGGTCVNVGCTPTKAMVASAYAAHLARRSAEYGVTIGGPISVDMKQVKARKDAIVARSRDGLEASLRNAANITVFRDHARFISPNEVTAGAEILSSKRIFVNVGGRPAIPSIPGLDNAPYLTSTTILDVDHVPDHLAVIGGSYVGLEFAQIFRRFGSKVTIIEAGPRLIHREDPEISDAVRDILEREGIDVRLDAKISRVAPGIHIDIDSMSGRPGSIHASHLLLAAGRRPNTADLGLDKAGVSVGAHGIISVDDALQTNVPGIWAMGECNGHGAFTHTAYNDFEIVAANLLDAAKRSVRDRIPAYGLFIDPPLGRVGMNEKEAVDAGHNVIVGSIPMARVSRAFEKGETLGLMKILADADTKAILGAAFLGVGGDEVVHSILDLMYAKVPYTLLQQVVHIHPTVAEFIPVLIRTLKPL